MVTVGQLIEMLEEYPSKTEIRVIDVDDNQEFSLLGLEPRATKIASVVFVIKKEKEEGL